MKSLKSFVLNHASRSASELSGLPDIIGHRNYSSVLYTECVSALDQQGSAWIPFVSDAEQWLEIDLGMPRFVSGVKVAGHPLDDAWVTQFRVLTSAKKGFNNDISHYVQERKVFEGCADRDTEVEVSFKPRLAQFIRIVPTGWQNRIGLRAGVVLSRNSLFPYQLHGRKNYFGDEVLFSSTRNCTTRCEADGVVLLLHQRDLLANGLGGRLYQDFPQFKGVLLRAAFRRHTHRLGMLARLRRGCSFRHFAAALIQKFWRATAVTNIQSGHSIGHIYDELQLNGRMRAERGFRRADSSTSQQTALGLSTDPTVTGLVNNLNDLRHDAASLSRKVDEMAASQSTLASQLEAVTAQLQQLAASKSEAGITVAAGPLSPGIRAAAGDTSQARVDWDQGAFEWMG